MLLVGNREKKQKKEGVEMPNRTLERQGK